MVILEGKGGSGWSGLCSRIAEVSKIFSSCPTMSETELCKPGKLFVGGTQRISYKEALVGLGKSMTSSSSLSRECKIVLEVL
jgi:hypothetical protein